MMLNNTISYRMLDNNDDLNWQNGLNIIQSRFHRSHVVLQQHNEQNTCRQRDSLSISCGFN